MKCCKCGRSLTRLNHYFVPSRGGKDGKRFCIACAREERIITLV